MNAITRIGAALAVCLLPACSGESTPAATSRATARPTPLQIVLAPQNGGDTELDRRVTKLQRQIVAATDQVDLLEQLGRVFVVKARTESDPGYYEMARQCALAIEAQSPDEPGALLLLGHVLHQEHQFATAEAVARRLVALRGSFLDQGLLGDVLLDRGQTDEATACYQTMLDEKPCLQSYARSARALWQTGDIDGARQMLDHAMSAGSSRDPEALAWVHTERARLELEAAQQGAALVAADTALQVVPDYPPALLLKGRALLASGDTATAAGMLRRAANARNEPEYLWTLEEALIAVGDATAAAAVGEELRRGGARDDARTYAVYLATRAERHAEALRLAEAELELRTDSHTHDALAWALHASGRPIEAQQAIDRALASGTTHPRIHYHAGTIAMANGDAEAARRWLRSAAAGDTALQPSERSALATLLRGL